MQIKTSRNQDATNSQADIYSSDARFEVVVALYNEKYAKPIGDGLPAHGADGARSCIVHRGQGVREAAQLREIITWIDTRENNSPRPQR